MRRKSVRASQLAPPVALTPPLRPNNGTPTSPTAVRAELVRIGSGARKRLGQHFLLRGDIAERMVTLAGIRAETDVVEIGPGLGALTAYLVPLARQLWLVEIDPAFAARLREQYAQQESVRVVQADACSVDWSTFVDSTGSLVVMGNLPYNVATEILKRLLLAGERIQRIVVMVQREVAERLRARPGDPRYSALSVLTQATAVVHKGFRVPPSAFWPAPRVESQVVWLEPRLAPEIRSCGFSRLATVVRAAFGQRRKQLHNSLSCLVANPIDWLRAAGIEPTRRPETLSLPEFAALAERLPDSASDA